MIKLKPMLPVALITYTTNNSSQISQTLKTLTTINNVPSFLALSLCSPSHILESFHRPQCGGRLLVSLRSLLWCSSLRPPRDNGDASQCHCIFLSAHASKEKKKRNLRLFFIKEEVLEIVKLMQHHRLSTFTPPSSNNSLTTLTTNQHVFSHHEARTLHAHSRARLPHGVPRRA